MKCPWCNNTLREVEGEAQQWVSASSPTQPMMHIKTTATLVCLTCDVHGNETWWKARIADNRGLPKGDR